MYHPHHVIYSLIACDICVHREELDVLLRHLGVELEKHELDDLIDALDFDCESSGEIDFEEFYSCECWPSQFIVHRLYVRCIGYGAAVCVHLFVCKYQPLISVCSLHLCLPSVPYIICPMIAIVTHRVHCRGGNTLKQEEII